MILICAGDSSGDLFGSHLISSIKKIKPQIEISAIGGEKMKALSDVFLSDLVSLDVFGFWEPFKKYFKLTKIFNKIKEYIETHKPKIIIFIDYFGFNIKIAEIATSLNIPTFYYIPPQIWASRENRIKKIKKYIKKVFVIYPFEEKIYKEASLDVTYVGHPLLEIIPKEKFKFTPPLHAKAGSKISENIKIGLFPGSRKNVVSWHLPIYKKIIERMEEFRFLIFGMNHLKDIYKKFDFENIVYEENYNFRENIDFAISTSGTVVLENALFGIPMIVGYRLPFLMAKFVKSIINVPYISIVNLIFNEEVVPELLQNKFTPENVADILYDWVSDNRKVLNIKEKFYKLRNYFGELKTSEIVAQKIIEFQH